MTDPAVIRVRSGKRVITAPHRPGDTVLATLRRAEIPIATQCEQAYCGTCVIELLRGEIRQQLNEALSDRDLASGLRLACQGYPEGEEVEIEIF